VKKLLLSLFSILMIGGFTYFTSTIDVAQADPQACPHVKIISIQFGNNGYGVPSGCDKVKVKVWGQGGASWVISGGVQTGGTGGAGGVTVGIVPVFSGTINTYIPGFPNTQAFGGGAGGSSTVVYQSSTNLALAPGGGGGGMNGNGFQGIGGAGGGSIGMPGSANNLVGKIAGGGGGGSSVSGGGGGTTTPFDFFCSGNTGQAGFGGNAGCSAATRGGQGGSGIFGGGGGAGLAVRSQWPAVTEVGGGGGGGAGWLPLSADPVTRWLIPGLGTMTGKTDDPDYIGGIATGGSQGGSPSAVAGGPGMAVLIFGEDITEDESRYPNGLSFGSFCPTLSPSPAPSIQSFPYPGTPPNNHPPGCTSTSVTCREDFYEPGSMICNYSCGTVGDPVPYVFKAC
jgi:hypothetical protein